MLRAKYKHLHTHLKISGKVKKEVYIFDKMIHDEFMSYEDYVENYNLAIEKEKLAIEKENYSFVEDETIIYNPIT
jgi:hypothetical protein